MSLVWKLRVYSREGQKWGYFLLSKTYPVTGTVDTRQLLSNIHSVSSPFRMTWETLDGVYLDLGCTQHSGPETHRAHKCHEMTWRFVVWLVALFLFDMSLGEWVEEWYQLLRASGIPTRAEPGIRKNPVQMPLRGTGKQPAGSVFPTIRC